MKKFGYLLLLFILLGSCDNPETTNNQSPVIEGTWTMKQIFANDHGVGHYIGEMPKCSSR